MGINITCNDLKTKLIFKVTATQVVNQFLLVHIPFYHATIENFRS